MLAFSSILFERVEWCEHFVIGSLNRGFSTVAFQLYDNVGLYLEKLLLYAV